MKNLWRILVIFMLPGMAAGGSTVIALFRLTDRGGELLINAALASLLWCGAFLVSVWLLNRKISPQKLYYCSIPIMAAAFAGGVGAVRAANLPGWCEGVAGVIIAGGAMPCFIHGFNTTYFNWRERWSFIAGALFSGAIVVYMTDHERLIWLETLFFYLAEFMLVCWCFASPFTGYGTWKKRWTLRALLLAAAVGAFFVSPVLNYLPWNNTPERFPESAYQRTFVTPQGSRFVWMDKDDNCGLFDAAGQLVCRDECDQDLLPAIPGWLGLLKKNHGHILAVVPVRSLLPEYLRKVQGITVDCHWEPASLNSCFDRGASALYTHFMPGKKVADQYDILFLDVLPDDPYPGVIRGFWQRHRAGLKDTGVVLVRGHLLQNRQLAQLLNAEYAFHGVMPGPGNIHVFAHQALDLTPAALEADLIRYWGNQSFILPGVYTLLCQDSQWDILQTQYPATSEVHYGRNRFWLGAWWWWGICAAGLGIWRLLRVASERRKQRYNYWKSAENGFASMGTVLLGLGILSMNIGIYALSAAVLALLVILLLGKVRSGGGWGAAAGLIIMAAVFYSSSVWHLLLLPVMAQAMIYCGNIQQRSDLTAEQCRTLWIPAGAGMFSAAVVMTAVWLWNIPLGVVWVWLAAARLPGIWQNKNMRVY
ncbi:MAG: hypothetical protein E7047_05070 [Lentisphaerae bacterium]|nr:hypothetical protein [Lentisphaerota bacterium]